MQCDTKFYFDCIVTGACYDDAVAVVTSGCVHEHLDTAFVCSDHLQKLERQSSVMMCVKCADQEPAHRCAIRILNKESSNEH